MVAAAAAAAAAAATAAVGRLQGEFAAMEVQLKELREELCGEQQTNHQMTFCEAKLAEKLQGECAAMDMQLKELRRELRGEQQTYHQMTFSEAKLAEKFPALELDLANLRAKQEVSERRLAKLSAKEIAEAQRFASQEESAQQLRGKLNRQLHLARQETDMAHRAESLVCEEASIQQKQKVRVQRLQGEFASSEAQLKELRVELQKEQQRYEQVVFNERQLKQQLELQEDSARRRELLLGEESRRRTEQAQAEAQGLIARVQELQDLERERYTAEVQAKKKELQRLATLQIEKEDFLQQIGDLQARLAQEQQAGKFLASQRMAAAKVQASVTEEMREILAERETDDAHQEARQRACAEELMDLRLDLELKTAAVAMSKERKPFVWRESPKPARSVGSSRARAARAESPRVVTQEAENKQTAAVPTVADELVALDEALKSFQAATEQGIKKAQQDSKTTELLLRGRLARAEAVSMRLQRELQVSEAQRNLGGTFQVLVMEAEEAQKAEAIGAEASGAEIEEPSSEDEEDEEDDDQTNKEMDEDDTQNSDDGHAEPPVSHSPIKAGAMGAGAQLGWRKSWAPQQFAKQLGEAVPPRGGLQKSQTTPVEWLDDDVEFHENDATRAVEDRAGRARSWRKSWAPESEHPLEIVDVRD
ncbi:unnamed protein product [Durusdinium trenchii]|uniref:Uncharacterized protein n=1 Tax=Durusdinium trenchii TaxID=1381693 RepID=A0ABP0P0A7_9DINO